MTILDDLIDLGDTVEDVVSALADAGVKGVRGACDDCPVARYLSSKGWTGFDVGSGRVVVEEVHMGDTDYVPTPLPYAVQQFITGFDDGNFPELEDA